MESFTMTLPSNVLSHEDNRIGLYTSKLAQRINLEGKWKVALIEINFPKSFWNIYGTNKMCLISKPRKDKKPLIKDEKPDTRKFIERIIGEIDQGFYDEPETLIYKINEKYREFFKMYFGDGGIPPMFLYDRINRHITIKGGYTSDKTPCFPYLRGNILNVLGLSVDSYTKFTNNNHRQEIMNHMRKNIDANINGKRPVDLTGGIHNLFVYTDIIAPNFVGDTLSKLLKVVEIPPDSKFGDQICIKYQRLIFQPLLKNEFETITIDIKDDAGETVPFQFGRSIVTLLFQKDE